MTAALASVDTEGLIPRKLDEGSLPWGAITWRLVRQARRPSPHKAPFPGQACRHAYKMGMSRDGAERPKVVVACPVCKGALRLEDWRTAAVRCGHCQRRVQISTTRISARAWSLTLAGVIAFGAVLWFLRGKPWSAAAAFCVALGCWAGCLVADRRWKESAAARRLNLLRRPFGAMTLSASFFSVLDLGLRHGSSRFLDGKTIGWILRADAWLVEADLVTQTKTVASGLGVGFGLLALALLMHNPTWMLSVARLRTRVGKLFGSAGLLLMSKQSFGVQKS